MAAFAADETETIRKAQALLERGDAAAASPLLEGAVARTPRSAELHYLLARSYTIEAKQSSNAVRLAFVGWNIGDELQAALALDPSRNDVRLDLIRYYEMTPRIVGGSPAKASLQAAELAKHDAALGAFARGYLSYREKQYGPARQSLRDAVKGAKDDATRILALTWLGWLSQETQQYDEAFRAFDEVLTLDPKHVSALYEIGRTALFSGLELDRGEEALRKYLAATPRFDDPPHDEAQKCLTELLKKK